MIWEEVLTSSVELAHTGPQKYKKLKIEKMQLRCFRHLRQYKADEMHRHTYGFLQVQAH